ncbi:ABC-2 type transporter [compost metagenome]
MKTIYSIIKISLKSYYLRSSNIVSLLLFPILTVVLFLQQTDLTKIVNLFIGSILLSSSLICINTLSRNIAMDKSFNRLWLYEVPNYKIIKYLIGVSLSSLIFVFLINIYLILISSTFVDIQLSFGLIFSILFCSIITWVIISPLGLIIGMFSKNIMTASSISSMITAVIISFSSSYSNNSFAKFYFLDKFSQILPITHLGNIYRFFLQINVTITTISIIYLLTFFIIEIIILVFVLKRFIKNTAINDH